MAAFFLKNEDSLENFLGNFSFLNFKIKLEIQYFFSETLNTNCQNLQIHTIVGIS